MKHAACLTDVFRKPSVFELNNKNRMTHNCYATREFPNLFPRSVTIYRYKQNVHSVVLSKNGDFTFYI